MDWRSQFSIASRRGGSRGWKVLFGHALGQVLEDLDLLALLVEAAGPLEEQRQDEQRRAPHTTQGRDDLRGRLVADGDLFHLEIRDLVNDERFVAVVYAGSSAVRAFVVLVDTL